MRKIKPIVLKKANLLSNEEMKNLFGGSAAASGNCTCILLLDNGSGGTYRQPASVVMVNPSSEGCHSGCSEMCSEMKSGPNPCTGYESTWD